MGQDCQSRDRCCVAVCSGQPDRWFGSQGFFVSLCLGFWCALTVFWFAPAALLCRRVSVRKVFSSNSCNGQPKLVFDSFIFPLVSNTAIGQNAVPYCLSFSLPF
jgi:hypothetical protein